MEFYYPLTLGVRRRKQIATTEPGGQSRERSRGGAVYTAWREEGVQRLDYEYEEVPEARVLDAVRQAAGQADGPFWLILGEPGAGKTKLLEAWFRRWIDGLASDGYGLWVPVLVKLRQVKAELLEGDQNFQADYLWRLGESSRALIQSIGSPAQSIYQASRARIYRPLWFLDGLDELSTPLLDERFFQALANLPGIKVLTCRTVVYGALSRKADRYKAKEYELLGLKPVERQVFLTAALGGDVGQAETLHRKIQKNTAVRLLAGNPLMLSLITELGAKVGLPDSRAAFYQAAIRKMWNRKLNAEPRAPMLTDKRDALLTDLAQAMVLGHIEAPCSLLLKNARRIAPDESELLIDLVRKAGLLSIDVDSEKFSFVHLTFQEFYLAAALRATGLQAALEKHWDDARYEETLGLLISLVYQEQRHTDIERAIRWLVEWGKKTHRKNPSILWQKQRSPLRTALHLIQRAAIPLNRLTDTADFLWAKINRPRSWLRPWRRSSALCRLAVALDSESPNDTLARLAQDPDEDVRQEVAGNANAPAEILDRLARDPDKFVRERVAVNANAPAKTLARLAQDPDEDVREEVARNANTLAETLACLAQDPVKGVRWGVAGNANTLAETLARLAQDPDRDVRHGVAVNASTPADALARLAQDPDTGVRWRVAGNLNTLMEDL